MDSARAIRKREVRHRGRAVVVANSEPDRDRRAHVEEDRHLAAKAQVLRSLADIEADRGFAFAGLAAVEQGQRVFDPEPAQALRHRLGRHHLDLEKPPECSARDLAVFRASSDPAAPCSDRLRLR